MKAKVTNTYDRISIRVTDGDRSLTLGWSRYRDTCSGRGLAKPLMDGPTPATAWGTPGTAAASTRPPCGIFGIPGGCDLPFRLSCPILTVWKA